MSLFRRAIGLVREEIKFDARNLFVLGPATSNGTPIFETTKVDEAFHGKLL